MGIWVRSKKSKRDDSWIFYDQVEDRAYCSFSELIQYYYELSVKEQHWLHPLSHAWILCDTVCLHTLQMKPISCIG